MFLGIALVRDDHAWNWGFVTAAVILCLLVRFLGKSSELSVQHLVASSQSFDSFAMVAVNVSCN